jgi:hypothetical protein
MRSLSSSEAKLMEYFGDVSSSGSGSVLADFLTDLGVPTDFLDDFGVPVAFFVDFGVDGADFFADFGVETILSVELIYFFAFVYNLDFVAGGSYRDQVKLIETY